MLTWAELEGEMVDYEAHYNMGYHEDGKAKGYGYRHRFEKHPRLTFVDYWREPDSPTERWERVWQVDGKPVPTFEDAMVAIEIPPVLTPEEAAAFAQVPRVPIRFDALWDVLAGCPRPPGGIMPDTPHGNASRLIDALRDKGVIEMWRHPFEPDMPGPLPYDTCVTLVVRREDAPCS
jgi:hypothetical protein